MPSVGEIVAIPALSLDAVSIPRPDAQARWVATSELADPSPFLEGGEILLTTGLVERDATGWRRFVGQLLDTGVVALGFGVGLSHPDVPAGLRKAATDLSFNLFSVPTHAPEEEVIFSDFMAKEVIASTGVTGRALTRITPILSRLASLFLERDMTLADWIVVFFGVAAIAWVNWYFFFSERGAASAMVGATGVQEALVAVRGGYDPATIRVSAGAPIRLTFDRQEAAGCSDMLKGTVKPMWSTRARPGRPMTISSLWIQRLGERDPEH